jgi:lysophospholipase L1-like esterase
MSAEHDPLAELRRRAQGPEPVLWNFVGDSIAHGALHTWGRRDYVQLFDERIRYGLGRRGDIVINASYNGYTIAAVAAELEQRCLRFAPDVVALALGMNDCCAGRDGLAAGWMDGMDGVHCRACGPSRPFCPCAPCTGRTARYTARRPGGTIHYLLDEPSHPNAAGHRLMADTLLRLLGCGPLSHLDPLEGFAPEPP